jgi:RNA polymerase sigma factor (sigma-70 family)
MPRPPWNLFGRLVRRLPPGEGDPAADADLVARFVHDRDPAAFELLVWRHGGLVLGVCRRILRDEHLAEDAFQATFLVLARKAGAVRTQNVAGWLHKVARRVAVRAAKKRSRVAAREGFLSREPAVETAAADWDWAGILDAEVGRLPDRFRLPVLLCYFQDYTTDEAARALGIPRGTVLSRLSTARQKIAVRLTRRGVTLPAALVSTSIASNQLVSATVRSAAAFAAGEAALTSAPTLLATEVIRMSAWKLPAAVAAAMVMTVSVGSSLAWVQTGGGPRQAAPTGASPQTTADRKTSDDKPSRSKEEDSYKKAVEDVLQSITPQIEALNQYISDRDKEYHRLTNELQDKDRKRHELSLEDYSTIQKQYASVAESMRVDLGNIRRDEQAVAEMETRLKTFDDRARAELDNLIQDVRIDPNSKDGIRLGVMYRKQAELESKIRELGIQIKRQLVKGEPELSAAKDELEVLQADIEKLETQAKARAAESVQARFARDHETRKRQSTSDIQFAKQAVEKKKEFIRAEEHKLNELLKLGIMIGGLESEISLIRERRHRLEWDIRDGQDKRNKLDLVRRTFPLRPPEMTIDQVAKELAEIRRELADLKRK